MDNDNGNCEINLHRDICSKEITLVGSRVYTGDEYPIAYNFLRCAQWIGLPMESLIIHRFSLDRIEEAMQVNIGQEALKVAIIL